MAGLLVAVPKVTLAEVAFHWVTVGDLGSAWDTQSQGRFGAVGYTYHISKYEITNAQDAEFLSAVAVADTYGVYDTFINRGKHNE